MKIVSTKFLLAIAVGVVSVAVVSGVAIAAKPTGNTRPGWGFGDRNHVHTGPPGQSVNISNNASVNVSNSTSQSSTSGSASASNNANAGSARSGSASNSSSTSTSVNVQF